MKHLKMQNGCNLTLLKKQIEDQKADLVIVKGLCVKRNRGKNLEKRSLEKKIIQKYK